MDIPITTREAYGRTLVDVSDPDLARAVARLTGRKTLTESDIAALRELGHTITGSRP